MTQHATAPHSSTKTLPPTYMLAAVTAMIALAFVAPGFRMLTFPWTMLGVVPLAAGVVLNLVADAAFKKYGTTVKPFEVSSALITTGAYRVCRHPMYLGFVLILVGLGVILGMVTPLLVVPLFAAKMEVTFVRAEEAMMEARFGSDWDEYKRRVRRWI